jgi:hypothetical protein
MLMKLVYLLLLSTLLLVLGSCQSSGRSQAIINGMAGETVSSVCFARSIRNWHPFDNSSIIVREGRDNYYKLNLVGACNANDAFTQIQLESRGGICLSAGDQVRFDRDPGMACSITSIQRWYPATQD